MTGTVLCTVGHGTRSLDELTDVLAEAGVELVVDVRRYPGSRRNPQFGRDVLERELPARGLAYEWWGDTLGGRRSGAVGSPNVAWRDPSFRAYADHLATDEFRGALDVLLERARQVPTAVMCAETAWWRCHRRLIADAAVLAGATVLHLGLGEPRAHEAHPALRIDERGFPVYDVGEQRALEM